MTALHAYDRARRIFFSSGALCQPAASLERIFGRRRWRVISTKINRQEVLMNSSRRWNDAPRKSEGEEAGDADRGESNSSESETGGV